MQAYPLQWPAGYPRTALPYRSKFETSFAVARDTILKEIKLLGGTSTVISTNIPLRNDGLPYATYNRISDKGVAVYFSFNGTASVLACDKWDKIEDNMQAIRKAIEALRGLDRWGVSDMLKRAFTGFATLPEPTRKPWYEVLRVDKLASEAEIKQAFRIMAKQVHPDLGGSSAQFQEVNDAYLEALATYSK